MYSTNFINVSPGVKVPDSRGSRGQTDFPTRQTETGRWKKLCPNCKEWIGLGPKGSEHSFITHQDGKRCRRVQQRKAIKSAAEELERSFGIHSSPTSPLIQAASSSSPSHESTHPKPHSPHFSHTIATARAVHLRPLPCRGIRYKWELGNVCKTYPFQYHDTGVPTWAARTPPPPKRDIIELESFNCAGFRDPSMEACLACKSIPNSREFKNVLRFALRDPTPDTPLIQLSWAQVVKRMRQVDEEIQRIHFEVQ